MKDKVAIIAGSTHGISRATALRFAREGARVVVNGRNEPAGLETIADIARSGGMERKSGLPRPRVKFPTRIERK